MRKVLSVVLGVVLTALALTIVGGTASASAPTVDSPACTAAKLALSVNVDTTKVAELTLAVRRACDRDDHHGNGNGNGHNNGGVGFPRFPNQTYNSCADYNRNGVYDIRRGDPRYRLDWDRGNRGIVCGNSTTIINNGDCTTYVTNNRNYGNLYNSNYANWNNLRLRESRHQSFTTVQRNEYNRLNRDMVLYRNNWNQSRTNLQTVCNQQPAVQIVEVPVAAAPVTVTQPAPVASAPAYSGSSNTPRGSVETGYVS